MEAVAIANARDPAEQAALPEERWLDVSGARKAAQVGSVELYGHQDSGRGEDGRHPIPGIFEVLPVGAVQAVGPRDAGAARLLIAIFSGAGSEWPWHRECAPVLWSGITERTASPKRLWWFNVNRRGCRR